MIFEIDENNKVPIYKQLQQQIILGIAQNKISPGDNLPSIRQLSDELSINPMTISKAYALLKEQGYLITDRRKGTMITQPTRFTDIERNEYLKVLELVLIQGYLHQETATTILADVTNLLTKYEKEQS